MKTRTVVHIALNAKNERVGNLIEVAGRLIPFSDNSELQKEAKRQTSFWLYGGFYTVVSVNAWKSYSKSVENAVRFQRVTLIGESK
jgi:hypothetical protein